VLDCAKLGISAGTVHDVFPIMRSATILRAWAGIEARMPDEIPVLVRAARARAFSTSSVSRGMDSSDCDADGFSRGLGVPGPPGGRKLQSYHAEIYRLFM
jgi:hypothetical protein